MRPEVADYVPGPADANLNMVQFAKSGVGIEFLSLHKKPTDGVIRLLPLFATKLVKCLHHGAIQIPHPKIRPAVLRHFQIRGIAKSSVLLVRGLDVCEGLCVSEIETVAEVNDGTQNSRIFDLAALTLAFLKGPPLGSREAVLPKIDDMAQPIPSVLAWLKMRLEGNDFSRDTKVATVVADHQWLGNHQRNCGLSSPLAVYMPVAGRKRRIDFLLAAIRFPVARIWLNSA